MQAGSGRSVQAERRSVRQALYFAVAPGCWSRGAVVGVRFRWQSDSTHLTRFGPQLYPRSTVPCSLSAPEWRMPWSAVWIQVC